MPDPVIRVALPADASAIADLSSQLGYPILADQAAERLAAILAMNDQAVLIACHADGPAVGWVHVFRALRIESRAFAEIGGLVVDEKHRGRGHGRRLVAAAEDWAMARGLTKLRVRTRSGRADARAFYENLGFDLAKEQHIYDRGCRADSR